LLLHVLLPLLNGILELDVFCHLGLLVTAIQMLNQDYCSDADIQTAGNMLDEYHRLNEEIFERKYLTYTNHALTHLARQRVMHGCPLVLMSNFVFEGYIATFKRQYHGSRGIISQMVRNIIVLQNIDYHTKSVNATIEVSSYISHVLKGRSPFSTPVEDGSELIGGVFVTQPVLQNIVVPDEVNRFCIERNTRFSGRLKVNGFIFHSLQYKRKGQSAGFYAEININGTVEFVTILYFVAVDTRSFGVVKLFNKTNNNIFDECERFPSDLVKNYVDQKKLGCFFFFTSLKPILLYWYRLFR